ncbi:site-specific DNA-methyltransferase [Thermomonas hydrothermalis]
MKTEKTMKKLTPNDPETRSIDGVAENIRRLKALFPELVTEGPNGAAVNVDVLKALVGDATVTDADEKYGLNWHGKRRARQLALMPSTGTLRPCPEDSVDWDTTQNLMIEGDNLEVLKLLQKSYAGKVKLIYIDPPYNTGNDFVYPDDYQDSIKNYLELTGQVEGGKKISSNTEASGRFHTDWLNMMYPRLKVARDLLRNDGILLVSIGDEEAHNLRELCDEILGGENFCGVFVWEKKKKPSFLDHNMGSVTDYVIAYAKNRQYTSAFVAGAVEDGKKYPFNNAGNPLSTLRFPPFSVRFLCGDQLIAAQDMSEGNIKTELLNDVTIVNGTNVNEFALRGEFRYSQTKLDEFVAAKAEIVISKVPFRPNYVNRSGEPKKTSNLLSHRVNGIPTNEDATEEIRQLFGTDVMSYPKPTGLVQYLIRATTSSDDIVMDFFAGSGTTGHAVMAQNIADGGNRSYILVQLPEPLDPENKDQKVAADFCDSLGKPRNIAELTKERLRRAAKKIKDENPTYTGDLGFRVFKLDSSNIRAWEPDRDNLDQTLLESIEHIKADRTESDVLYELLLKLGLDLCVPIETRTFAGKEVHSVGGGVLMACLAPKIERAEVEALAQGIVDWHKALAPAGDTTCVFRDSAFADDVAKTNMAAILEQHGITNVRSL